MRGVTHLRDMNTFQETFSNLKMKWITHVTLFIRKRLSLQVYFKRCLEDQAAKLVQELGADIDISVNKRTDFVIVGQGAGPSKLKKTEDLIASGSSIRILNETEFISNLNMK